MLVFESWKSFSSQIGHLSLAELRVAHLTWPRIASLLKGWQTCGSIDAGSPRRLVLKTSISSPTLYFSIELDV